MKKTSHPWSLDISGVADTFTTDLKKGLSDTEVNHRLATYGKNTFSKNKDRSPIEIFFKQLKNPLIIVLAVAVLITLILAEWLDASVISLAIIVNTILGFIQEYKAEKAISNLRSYIRERVRVIRSGQEFEIDASQLVPGDLINITLGSRISADARLIQTNDFSTDEALLTGESLPVSKNNLPLTETTLLADRDCMVYAGTLAVTGNAYAIVTDTGEETEIGKLAKLVSETQSEKTPLQKAVLKLTWVIIAIISVIVIGIFSLGISQDQPVLEMLLLCIAIIVGAVPEALPMGLTAVLAVGVEQIAKKKGIMRSLTAAETLGSTTVIITDKTGTLTEANMKLVDIVTLDNLISQSIHSGIRERYSHEQKELLKLALCNTDTVIENPKDKAIDWKISGAPLEKNIVRAAGIHDIQLSPEDWADIKKTLPFSSLYKFSVTSIPSRLLPGGLLQFENPNVVIGAPDILLERSNLDKDTYIKALEAINLHSHAGRRLLGIGLLTPKTNGADLNPEDVHDIFFLGILGFYDPIRPDVISALERIKSYGVHVVMATGDLPGTALAVAKDLGWSVNKESVLTGEQLKQLSDKDLKESLVHVRIFARVTPEDKLRITRLYQTRGEIVAMTGDGVNDGPSLKAANIGIAVGSGSDVAKSIADLVLLDDSFNTIVASIEEGKRMLVNIKKIFIYLMSNSLDEVILIGGAIVMGLSLPLTALQIIWVNLFTGSIPAIAFAFDKQAVPKGKYTGSFFDPSVKFLTIWVGTLTSILLFILYSFLLTLDMPIETVKSIIFACFGSYILVIAFSFRNIEIPIYKYSIFENRFLFWGVMIGLVLLFSTLYVPFLQDIFSTSYLPLPWLIFVIIWLIFNIILIEISKWFAYTYLKK